MTKPIVAFDESGNSGANLLDPAQPVFVLASVHLDENESVSVLSGSERELKFTRLKRSASGRQTIIDVLSHPVLSDERYLLAGFHKPFMVITKMVDLLVEPMAKRDSIDLYERGANLAFSNLLFFCLPVWLGRRVLDLLMERFVTMVRFPSDKTITRFYQLLETAYRKHCNQEYVDTIGLLLATRSVAEGHRELWNGIDLDPAIPAFFEHASKWTEDLAQPFRIVHDMSKPLLDEQVVLEAMLSTSEPPISIGFDRRKSTFPINAEKIELLDSRDWPQLQIADIMASATAHVLRARILDEVDDFCEALAQTPIMSGRFHPVWPEYKFTPEELGTIEKGGIDPIEHIGDYVSERLGGIPPRGRRRKR